jgi:NADH:ubiquinone oxidoreductase subunit 5 (subunit L)/multisubunit Na+/H+ antiporter MnhA subunit
LLKILNNLSSDQRKFVAEVIGTFIVVVFATGSVVIDAKLKGALGIPFIAFAPFVGVAIGVYLFGRISMAHFNPAVTIGFLITNHITKIQLVYYLAAEVVGALLGSLFVKYIIGNEANLGANAPNYAFPIAIVFGTEVLATALLMAVIAWARYSRKPEMEDASGFGKVLANKWYVDELYDVLIVKPLNGLSRFLDQFMEKSGIDWIVNGVGRGVQYTSRQLRLLQSGQVGNYVLLMIVGTLVLFALQFFLKK